MPKPKVKSNDIVTISCYGQIETMTREEALDKYLDCMRHSEGSERERYENIYFALLDGEKLCYDM